MENVYTEHSTYIRCLKQLNKGSNMKVIAAISTVVSCVNLFIGFPTVTVTDRKFTNIFLIMISFRTILLLTTLFSKHKLLSGFQSFRPKPFTLLSSTQYFEHLKILKIWVRSRGLDVKYARFFDLNIFKVTAVHWFPF